MTIIVIKLPQLLGSNCKETAHQMFVTDGRDEKRRTTVGAVSYNVMLLDVPWDRRFVQASLAVDKRMGARRRKDDVYNGEKDRERKCARVFKRTTGSNEGCASISVLIIYSKPTVKGRAG